MTKQGSVWRNLWQSGLFARFLLLCLGVWLHAADTLVSATILPSAVQDIGGLRFMSWSLALYECGSILAGAVTPLAATHLGLRRMMSLGAALFAAGCLAGAAAPSMAVLLAGRLAQGFGGGILVSLSYVAIERYFPPSLWTRLLGLISIIWGVGALLGPLIGGLLADAGAWRLAFAAFAVQATLLAVAGRATFPAAPFGAPAAPSAPSPTRLPWQPLLLLMLATGLIAQASILGGILWPALAGAGGLALLYAAACRDRVASIALLPRGLLAIRTPFGAGLFTSFALATATTGFSVYGPLLLKSLSGVSSLTAGYVLAMEALSWSLVSIATAARAARAERGLIRLGACCILLGVAGFAVAMPKGCLPAVVVSALFQGGGFGLCWAPLVARSIRLAPLNERSVAAGAANTIQSIGYAIGAAATGIAGNAAGLARAINLTTTVHAAFWIFAAFLPLLLAALASAWRFTARETREPTPS